MKGYKGTYGMKCLTLTYEVGRTYSIDEIKMCEYGFHFCGDMKDVLKYYDCTNDFVLLEVEALGEVISEGDKRVTNELKVVRVVPKEEYVGFPVYEYDTNGNQIHCKDFNGYEKWHEYDANNNLIHYKDSNGYERWHEYDANNNLVHYRNSCGYERWYEYDANNNLIHFKDSGGYEEWKEYDANNNLIHYKNSDGKEWRITIND